MACALVASASAGATESAPPRSAAHPTAWVLVYEGKSSNDFIWDERAKRLIQSRVPATLSDDVLDGLGGPPDPVSVTSGRYLAATACVHRFCPDKGFFWIDARTGAGLGAYYADGEKSLRIGSNGLRADGIPAAAREALVAWLGEHDLRPASVAFVSRTGAASPLPPARFTSRRTYFPPAGGPSFDCRKALTPVEKAICADASLSKQDLELGRLVQQVRQGHATAGAR